MSENVTDPARETEFDPRNGTKSPDLLPAVLEVTSDFTSDQALLRNRPAGVISAVSGPAKRMRKCLGRNAARRLFHRKRTFGSPRFSIFAGLYGRHAADA